MLPSGRMLELDVINSNYQIRTFYMSDKISESALNALKIAFTYMPKPIEVTKYEYGDDYQKILDHIETVREILLINDVDPEEVYGEVNPESTPNSSY
jgi:hypothetical protein